MPTRMMKRSPGNPAKMSSSDTPMAVPTPKAATRPSTPMLMGSTVATAKTATRMRMEMSSLDMRPPAVRLQRLPHDLHGMAGLPAHTVRDLLPARHPCRGDERAAVLPAQRGEQSRFADLHRKVVVL